MKTNLQKVISRRQTKSKIDVYENKLQKYVNYYDPAFKQNEEVP